MPRRYTPRARPQRRLSPDERADIWREYERSEQLGYCGSAWIAARHGITRNHVNAVVRDEREIRASEKQRSA